MDNNNTVGSRSSNLTLAHGGNLPQGSLLEILLRHRWLILLTIILCLVAAFLYLLRATPTYTSTSRLYVEQTGPKIISEYEGVMTRSKNYLYTQGELIKSTPIIANVVDDARLKRLKTFAQKPSVTPRRVDMLFDYVKDKLNIHVDR